MPWSSVTQASITTYVAVASGTYSWQQLSSISTAGGDQIGFELKVSDQFPMFVNDTFPVYLLD